jgi:hypothetical protein
MALSFLDNVDYRGKKPNFTRDLFDDITAMAAYDERYLPDIYEANLKSDGSRWRFNRNNEVDAVSGRWREVKGGMGDIEASEDEEEAEEGNKLFDKWWAIVFQSHREMLKYEKYQRNLKYRK